MIQCSHCFKTLQDDVVFCPYCGQKVATQNADHLNETTDDSREYTVQKQLSKKSVLRAAIALLIFALLGTVVFCEIKIANAKRLYSQAEYWKAYKEVRYIPDLGREDIIRIKIASFAGDQYESYLTIKRIRLSSTSGKYRDAYEDAFWELMFGLYLDLRDVQNDGLNEIEIDEYEKFIDIYYDELDSMFNMSKHEADELVKLLQEIDSVQEKKEATNDWLDDNFFD